MNDTPTTERPSDRPLTRSDAVALATIVEAAIHGTYVGRATESGDVMHGTARSIGNQTGGFATERDDIRDEYLRVTLSTGFDAFWPVAELMTEVNSGMFVAPFDRPAYERATTD